MLLFVVDEEIPGGGLLGSGMKRENSTEERRTRSRVRGCPRPFVPVSPEVRPGRRRYTRRAPNPASFSSEVASKFLSSVVLFFRWASSISGSVASRPMLARVTPSRFSLSTLFPLRQAQRTCVDHELQVAVSEEPSATVGHPLQERIHVPRAGDEAVVDLEKRLIPNSRW